MLVFAMRITVAWAQSDEDRAQEFRMQQEQRKRAMLMQTMDSAVVLMDDGKHAEADEKFIQVLNGIKSVPSDLVFYFGKNSYYLKKYKQSSDWLNKYIQLKGTSGQFFAEAAELVKKADAQISQEVTRSAPKTEVVLTRQYDIDCGPSGKVTCPVCKGTTVLIKRGPFENQYKTCPYCDSHGILTCEEYNLLIRGQLQPRH
jgi:hypothetical protein